MDYQEIPNSAKSSPDLGKLTVGSKIGYGMGDFAASIVFQAVTLFLLYYFTDVFLLGATTAGIVFFISKIWNAVCDPTMGYVADRTRTRWGRNRPFLLFGALPLGASFFLLFASPDLTGPGKTTYALITFLAFSTAYSVINIPYGALTANLTLDTSERSSLTAYRMAFAILGALTAAGTVKPLVALFPDEISGFRAVGAAFGLICIAVNVATFLSVRERVSPPLDESMSLKQDLSLVVHNRPFLLLTISTIIQMVSINVLAAMLNYYFKYNLGAETYIPVAFLCFFATAMAMLPVWVKLSNRIGKKASLICGMSLLGGVLITLRLTMTTNIPLILALFVVGGAGMSTQYLCPWAMIPDTVEYSQWKTGLRREGILYGFFNFSFKFSAAFAGIIAGFGLDFYRYVPNAEQAPATLQGIARLMTIVPAALIFMGLAVIWFYPIDAALHGRMVDEIKARA
ncbi:MAG: MFS transporter [Spirochaetota bacterium]